MANKIGDVLLLFACLYILINYNSLYFNTIFSSLNSYFINLGSNDFYSHTGHFIVNYNKIDYIITTTSSTNINDFINLSNVSIAPLIICIFIIIASICKSAQAGFHF